MAVTSFHNAPCVTKEPDLFESVAHHDGAAKVRACKAVCATCPSDLKAECLTLGFWDGMALDGVFGGLSKAEREAMV
jgi:hypothetical protein